MATLDLVVALRKATLVPGDRLKLALTIGHAAVTLFQLDTQISRKSCGASAVGNWTVDHWCFLLQCMRTTAPEALKSWLQTCGQCINAIRWKTRLFPRSPYAGQD